MIQFVKHKNINTELWDNCIANSKNSLIYGYSWYLNIICPGWNAVILNNYEAVMPLPTKGFGWLMCYQPFFAQKLGIFYTQNIGLDLFEQFIYAIPSNYKYIYFSTTINPTDYVKGAWIEERKNFVLNLNQPLNEITNNFNKQNSRNLKQAFAEKLAIKETQSKHVVDFYIKHKSKSVDKIKNNHYHVLNQLLRKCDEKNKLMSFTVLNQQNQICAAASFLVDNNRFIFQIGTANDVGRKNKAMYLIFYELIKKYANQPVLIDFEGSEIENIARFFKGFGAKNEPYYFIKLNQLPWPVNLLKK